ncbi:MAG: dienelactone hydrolase family protein [Bacteroidota bacterium]
MKYLIIGLAFCWTHSLLAQEVPKPEEWGLTHIPFTYQNEPVDLVLLSGGTKYDTIKKPLFLFVQGSLPKPLLISNKKGDKFSVFPFNPMSAFAAYHFVMIGKPAIPLNGIMEDLQQPYLLYHDPKTGAFPRKYCQSNHLDYYVERNKAVLEYLAKQDWVDESRIVVAGHSEGVSVSFKMAIEKVPMTHLILLNAGLTGRIMAIVTNHRQKEENKEDYEQTEALFNYWKSLVETTPKELSDDCSLRDSHKATASFSYPYRQHLKEIDIPVFFGYGTKDESVLLMDQLRLETIRAKKENYYFKSYFGWEHNFFGFNEDGSLNYEDYNYDKVATDFFKWLKNN